MGLEILLPLAGGFMEGKGEGRKRKMADELHMAQMNLIKQQGKAAEAALAMQQLKDKIFGGMTPEEQKAAAFPKADDTLEAKLKAIMNFSGQGGVQPVTSLPEQIAQARTSGEGGGLFGLTQEDLLLGLMKKEFGAERPKYNRIANIAGPGGAPYVAPMNERGLIDVGKAVPSPVKYEGVNVTTPTGDPGRQWVDPYNPPRGIAQTGPAEVDFRATTDLSGNEWEIPYVKGTAIPAVDAKPRLKNPTGLLKPMNPQDLANWRHKETGEHPPPGIKPADLASKGYVPVSSGEETRAMSMEAADAIIGRIDGLADKVFVAEGIGARAASGPKKKFSYWLGTDPDLDLYESLKSGLMANIARTFGERGTLTDRDIDRIQKLFPVAVPTFGRPLPDSRTVAKRKLGEIKDIIAEISKRKPKAGGRGPSLDLGGGNSAKPKTWEELKAGAK